MDITIKTSTIHIHLNFNNNNNNNKMEIGNKIKDIKKIIIIDLIIKRRKILEERRW